MYLPEIKHVIDLINTDIKRLAGAPQRTRDVQEHQGDDPEHSDHGDEDEDDAISQQTAPWRAHLSQMMLLLHRYTFLLAAACHPLQLEEEEKQRYQEAEDIRRDILRHATAGVATDQHALKRHSDKNDESIVEGLSLALWTSDRAPGIHSAFALQRFNELAHHTTAQGKLVLECRRRLMANVMRPITTDKADGEEYDRGLSEQEHGFGYMVSSPVLRLTKLYPRADLDWCRIYILCCYRTGGG